MSRDIVCIAVMILTVSPLVNQSVTAGQKRDCWELSFEDNFDELRLREKDTGMWKTSYIWGNDQVINNELQYYIDPRIHDASPFTIEGGVLVIQARPTLPLLRAMIGDRPYTSGLLTTEKSFTQRYGRFEIRARLPRGRGLWPAFWLLPAVEQWPEGVDVLPEIDVMEHLGQLPRVYYTSMHTNQSGHLESFSTEHHTGMDLTAGYHVYGVEWDAESIHWYLDGRRLASRPTPRDLRGPAYLLVNLAVGGDWPKHPDATTPFPAKLRIDYVRVYRHKARCVAD